LKKKKIKSEIQQNRFIFNEVKCLSTNVTTFSCSCNSA